MEATERDLKPHKVFLEAGRSELGFESRRFLSPSQPTCPTHSGSTMAKQAPQVSGSSGELYAGFRGQVRSGLLTSGDSEVNDADSPLSFSPKSVRKTVKLMGPFPSCSMASSSSSGTLTRPVRIRHKVTQVAVPCFPGSEGRGRGNSNCGTGGRWGMCEGRALSSLQADP